MLRVSDELSRAVMAIESSSGGTNELTAPILEVIDVTGVSVSTLGFLGAETLDASDRQAAKLDEVQFDLGEGPCWDALASGRPVLEPEVRSRPTRTWPAFAAAIQDEAIGGVFAFPLLIGPLRIGAMDLYNADPGALSESASLHAQRLAGALSRYVLRRALQNAGEDERPRDEGPFSRRLVHQATGFVIAQLGISARDAELLIQGQAFAESRSMREIAQAIVDRRLVFRMDAQQIEDAQ
jgi:hypothetical protein